jgi:hypothetical protein
VQAGLHEASHSIDHAQTENSIKTRNGIGSYALLDAAVKEFKGKTTDDYPDINDPVNRQLSGNLSEGLADGSAVRFMLQRYGNKPEVVKFAQDFANFRQANPNRTGYVTHSVIRQVLEDWQARGQPNDPSYTLTQAVADTHGVMKNNLRDLVHTIAAGQFNNDPKNPAKDQEAFRPLLKEPSTPAATLRQTHVAHSADAKNKLCGPKVAAP